MRLTEAQTKQKSQDGEGEMITESYPSQVERQE